MRRVARFFPVAAAAALLLLLASSASGANSRKPSARYASTAALVKDAKLAALVDALAKKGRVDDEYIGFAAQRSAVYAKLARAASPALMLRLLRHRSAAVRLYAAEHVVKKLRSKTAQVYPLLADRSRITTQSGCTVATEAVGDALLQTFANHASDKQGAVLRALIRRAAADGRLPAPIRRSAKAFAKRL